MSLVDFVNTAQGILFKSIADAGGQGEIGLWLVEVFLMTNPLRNIGVSAFPALALAIALTYVLGDFFRPFLPRPLGWLLDIALCFALYKITYYYLSKLRE